MARRNLYNNQHDITRPPESSADADSIVDGKTIPDESDVGRGMETQPDDYPSPMRKTEEPTAYPDNGRRDWPTLAPRQQMSNTIVDDTVSLPNFERSPHRNRRVVGWMVGIKGPCRGVDYRLHEGKNYIGRDMKCEVNVEDLKVSAGNVAQVVFDPRSKCFFSSDCDGTATICYQNGEPLLGRSEIKIYDRIELGESALVFVPLCGEAFTWDEDENKKDKD